MQRLIVMVFSLSAIGGSDVAMAQTRSFFTGWTISDSATDPFSNTGAAAPDTLRLYVWLWCAVPQSGGVSTAQFGFGIQSADFSDVHFGPGVVDSDPNPGFFDLSFSGCPSGTMLVADFKYTDHGFGEYTLCPSPSAAGTVCGSAIPDELAWLGYTAGQGVPCVDAGDFFAGECSTTAVSSGSWGRVKALYRDR